MVNTGKLVISIVTWNSEKTIADCLRSVLLQSIADFELFVVDNDSADSTVSILESFADHRIKLEKKKENTGFCGGHNYVINNSSADYVLLVNPDVILPADYAEKAIASMQSGDRIGTVCGLLLQGEPSSKTLIDSAGLEMRRSGIMRMLHHGELAVEVDLKKKVIFGADGALPLYSRAMINDISIDRQFFDEMFFAHKEDWDVSWRSHHYGWKTVFDPECVAVHPRHFKPKSLKVRNEVDSKIKIHSVKNQLILLLKNVSLQDFLKNAIFILPRQVIVLGYLLLFERNSLGAYSFIFRNYTSIIAKRKVIQSKRVNQ